MNKLHISITISLAALLLSGCYTANRAIRQVIKAQAYHPGVVAALCGSLYPPLTIAKDSIVYKEGDVQYLSPDTLSVDCDTVTTETVLRIPCPPCPYRVDSFYRYTERQVENRAAIAALQHEARSLQSRYDKLSVKNTWLLWWAIIATAVVAMGLFFRLYRA